MPHECTNCGRAFADGSKEMLSGCPNCGGNKFQFRPAGAGSADGESAPDQPTANQTAPDRPTATPSETTPAASPDSPGASRGGSDAGAVGRAASTVREWVGTGDDDRDQRETPSDPAQPSVDESDRSDSPDRSDVSDPSASSPVDDEDTAQAHARTDVVAEDELPDRSSTEGAGTVVDDPDGEKPSLDELREELNSQFESIKVVNPGQYELNLMELYERKEYIIALQENGRYVIQVPDSWTDEAES